MVRVREFEHAARDNYQAGKLPGFLHLSVGQEAVSVGACAALREDDYMASTHRGHGDTIAKGVTVEAAMAELFGRVTGTSHAKGGSMHIADFDRGILGANGIVAAGIPIAVGAALSAQYRGTDQVALAFFGDGATAAGPLHEAMNMSVAVAAAHDLCPPEQPLRRIDAAGRRHGHPRPRTLGRGLRDAGRTRGRQRRAGRLYGCVSVP